VSDYALLPLLFLIGWFLCMFFAADLGRQKNAGVTGLFLGCLFGPFGVVAAGLLDGRPLCFRCGGRQNIKPGGVCYEVCEHCGGHNAKSCSFHRLSSAPANTGKNPAPPAIQVVESIGRAVGSFLCDQVPTRTTIPPDECTTPLENDPEWESSMNEAKQQLEAAGLIGASSRGRLELDSGLRRGSSGGDGESRQGE
jgi:hypothetical protein